MAGWSEQMRTSTQTAGTGAVAVGPASRDAYIFAIVGTICDETLPQSDIDAINRRSTDDWTTSLRSLTPGSGTYLNEADVMDLNKQRAFYGSKFPSDLITVGS
jgi:hypothetical protein